MSSSNNFKNYIHSKEFTNFIVAFLISDDPQYEAPYEESPRRSRSRSRGRSGGYTPKH